MRKTLVVLTLIGSAFPAMAVYKCGNTYSQTPCAADAKKLEISESLQSSSGVKLRAVAPEKERANIEICEKALRTIPAWKDRESLKIGTIRRGLSSMNTNINGVATEVVPYVTTINGKNSYGAYGGEKAAACFFDMKDEKLLDYFVGS